ncbi:MAG: exonuclease domain-containing protein, partial [Clostridia bacterium]|nr:exonuclease domain-containing protein [Clostridia bacterium]
MNKRLSDIFNLVENEILKHSEAVSINVYPEDRVMEIVAKCVKMVRKESARNLEEQIMSSYKLKDVSLEFVYDKEVFNANSIKTVAGYLVDYPQIVPIINNAECSIEENTLYIDCLDGGIIDEEIKEALLNAVNRMFGIDIKIEFIRSKTDEEMEAQFELEKKEIYENIEKARISMEESKKKSPVIYGREIKKTPDIEIADITELSGNVVIDGYLFKKAPDIRETRNGAHIVTFSITDDKNAINCKIFTDDNGAFSTLEGRLKKGTALRVSGQAQYDKYARELLINVRDLNVIEWEKRTDTAEEKRVELHLHTKMSTMDAMADADALVSQAIKWGHKAVAITDHGDVQAFPEAYHAANWGKDIKVLYGVECYLVNDSTNAVANPSDNDLDSEFVVFDIETTGLSPVTETITEIGAVKVKNGQITETFNKFVNPGKAIPQKIVELTGITDAMVADADPINVVLPEFYEFIGDAALVAHNASFDYRFLAVACSKCNLE